MSKTTKACELTEAKLAAVSGGLNLHNAMISGVVARPAPAAPGDTGTDTVGWDLKRNWTA